MASLMGTVGVLEDQLRGMLTALQSHVKIPLTTNQPVVAWHIEHAAYLLNKYQLGVTAVQHTAASMAQRPENAYANSARRFYGLCPKDFGARPIATFNTVCSLIVPSAAANTLLDS